MVLVSRDVPPNMKVIDDVVLYPRNPSGLTEYQNSIYRYSLPDSKQPVLRLSDYIIDYNGGYLSPGMYELALSDDKEFLLIIQSGKLLAVIPVFKLAEDEQAVQEYRNKMLMDSHKKYKPRKLRYKEKLQKVLRAKYAEDAITPPAADEDYTYMNATIEYIEEGGYYLVTYENGMYRAWGAIKTRDYLKKNPPMNLRGKSY